MDKIHAQTTTNTQQATFYWHDYETFGLDPGRDRPAQFAGVRTDLDFNLICEPHEWYCRIPRDYLPDPLACLITGITPQKTLLNGLFENEFIQNINDQFSQFHTCVVGYNNIRFDDEVTRFALYRNFLDPYQREWKNNCSRWDIIDLVRACYALRPQGIKWPVDDDNIPSFRLELLTKENGLSHAHAHDAMSDVYATINVAQLIKQKQPKLFDYCFDLRKKENVRKRLYIGSHTPLIHVSGMFPASQGCISYVLPIAMHPTNKNSAIVVELNKNVEDLVNLSVEDISKYLYTQTADLPEGINRPAIKLIHINKCPFIAPVNTLTVDRAEELGINQSQWQESLDFIKHHPELTQKLISVFNVEKDHLPKETVEEMLYTGGFFSNKDKAQIDRIALLPMQDLLAKQFEFDDPRLASLLFHYRARNAEEYLSQEESDKWQRHCQGYFSDNNEHYIEKINNLLQENQNKPDMCDLLHKLLAYIDI
ncbi:MAG: exodeoxyribonuclease I [Psychromonas sp.]|nr:exodeoxyribonuclease I [Psychromonas sp.]